KPIVQAKQKKSGHTSVFTEFDLTDLDIAAVIDLPNASFGSAAALDHESNKQLQSLAKADQTGELCEPEKTKPMSSDKPGLVRPKREQKTSQSRKRKLSEPKNDYATLLDDGLDD